MSSVKPRSRVKSLSLSDQGIETAARLGCGNVSAGVKYALQTVTARGAFERRVCSAPGVRKVKAIAVWLDDHSADHAKWLGHGNASAGVRYALAVCAENEQV